MPEVAPADETPGFELPLLLLAGFRTLIDQLHAELATRGHIADWRIAFEHGEAKATGIEQVIKLIVNVVERQEERSRTRRARH